MKVAALVRGERVPYSECIFVENVAFETTLDGRIERLDLPLGSCVVFWALVIGKRNVPWFPICQKLVEKGEEFFSCRIVNMCKENLEDLSEVYVAVDGASSGGLWVFSHLLDVRTSVRRFVKNAAWALFGRSALLGCLGRLEIDPGSWSGLARHVWWMTEDFVGARHQIFDV